ncbi:MAG: N-acetylmuramoyl-L-alanine amidase, partial [Actinobacteria bacterium]|nr:N-acetylmuramoyl-L-alanine amidase [Actinomycetota bacterium]
MLKSTFPRLLMVLVLTGAALVGGFPPAGGALFPDTVMRSVGVPTGSLLPGAAGSSPARAPRGGIRALTAARTATLPVCAPIWFTAVALTWDQAAGAPVSAHVAWSGDGSSYARPVEMDAEGGPDPGSPDFRRSQQGTTVLWTGGSRCIRFSLHLPAGAELSNVRVLLMNSSGTASGPGTAPAPGAPSGLFAPQAAEAMTRRPRFITREQWGADESLRNCDPYYAPAVKMGFVHHTAGVNTYTESESDDIVRAILAYHTNGRGWCDIAYNFLVDRFGNVFEGRAGGVDLPVVGAATQGFNTGSFSVSVMGNFDAVRPPAAAVRALQRVVAWRLDVAHLPPRGRADMVSGGGDNTRYSAGTEVTLRVVSGHRDTGYTDCPGGRLYATLRRIRRAVAGMGLPKIYRPTLSPPSVVAGDGQSIGIGAWATEALEWNVTVVDQLGSIVTVLPRQSG